MTVIDVMVYIIVGIMGLVMLLLIGDIIRKKLRIHRG